MKQAIASTNHAFVLNESDLAAVQGGKGKHRKTTGKHTKERSRLGRAWDKVKNNAVVGGVAAGGAAASGLVEDAAVNTKNWVVDKFRR